MFYLPFSLFCIMGGVMLYMVTWLFPVARNLYFDWIAIIVLIIPSVIFIYGMHDRKTTWLMEKVPKSKMLTLFLRRDGDIVPVLGTRAYPGESFIDIPKLGLIHDLGNVYRWGQNNVRFAIENVNHTADPKYASFTDWLYKIGFNNIAELKAVVTPKKDNGGQDTDESSYPEKEEEVLEKIPYYEAMPADILAEELAKTDKELPEVKKEEDNHSAAVDFIRRVKGGS